MNGIEFSIDDLTKELVLRLTAMHETQKKMLAEYRRIAAAIERITPPEGQARKARKAKT